MDILPLENFLGVCLNVHAIYAQKQPCLLGLVSFPDPNPRAGKGLGQLSVFLVFASSAVVFSRKPIRSQLYSFHVTLHPVG